MNTLLGLVIVGVGVYLYFRGKIFCFSLILDFRKVPKVKVGYGKAWAAAYFKHGKQQMFEKIYVEGEV